MTNRLVKLRLLLDEANRRYTEQELVVNELQEELSIALYELHLRGAELSRANAQWLGEQ